MHRIPVRELWWLVAGGASYGARYVHLRVSTARGARRASPEPDPTGELLRLQTLYGYNAHSLVSIAPGARLWSTPEIDGAIIYSEFGRVWLAAGDPLAPAEDVAELARQFAAFAKRKNRVVAFVPTTTEFARHVTPHDFTAVKVGAAPYFDLQTWNPRGDSAKKLRAGVNQARRGGVGPFQGRARARSPQAADCAGRQDRQRGTPRPATRRRQAPRGGRGSAGKWRGTAASTRPRSSGSSASAIR